MIIAYAAVQRGAIDIRTVHPTIRGAMVNALYLGGTFVGDGCSDETIKFAWRTFACQHGYDIISVAIEERSRIAQPWNMEEIA